MKLVQNSVDWNATSMTVSVTNPDGTRIVTGTGTILQDAGIDYIVILAPRNRLTSGRRGDRI